ncbi:MAG: peptidylprolyl isomerase [SAR324 cluster bacterium]|nr:peptidylprolyl isomerase [SAR324 cluster bacterium]
MKITQGAVVKIDYELKTEKGTLIDTTEGRDPLSYVHGNGNIIPGLEAALEGENEGKELSVSVPAEDGYGLRNSSLVARVPKKMFDGVKDLEIGMQLRVETTDGIQTITIVDIEEDTVIIDGNHPLAGHALTFDVKVISVEK